MDSHTNSIEQKLRQAWSQERRFIHLRGASRFVIWLIVMIAVDFIIDWGIVFRSRMTVNMGLLLLAINVAVLAWVLWHEWLRYLKPYDPLLVALEVEGRHPELSSLLVSYTQLDDIKKNQPNVSPDLVQAMQENAVIRTKPLDFREIVDFGQLTRLFSVAGGVLLLFAVISYSWPEHMRTLLERLAGGDTEYPTQTQIVSVDGAATVRVGDSVTISAVAAGVIPEEGTVYTKTTDGAGGWRALPMQPRGANSAGDNPPPFERGLEELTQDVMFYVRIGDDQSDVYHVRVVAAPRVEAVDVALVYPSYMALADGQGDQLNLEVPTDTGVQWQITSDTELESLLVTVEKEQLVEETDEQGAASTTKKMVAESIPAVIDRSGKVASFSALADKDLRYTFHWTVRSGGELLQYDDVRYNVRVVADAVPDIELLQPSGSGLATVDKRLRLAARASDDYGLAKAWLVYSVSGDSEEKRLLIQDEKQLEGAKGKEIDFQWNLGEHIEGLEPGKQVSLAIEVVDLHSEDHLRRSATRHLTIVEPERYLQWYRAELASQHDEIQRARAVEQVSSTKVKEIKVQEGDAE